MLGYVNKIMVPDPQLSLEPWSFRTRVFDATFRGRKPYKICMEKVQIINAENTHFSSHLIGWKEKWNKSRLNLNLRAEQTHKKWVFVKEMWSFVFNLNMFYCFKFEKWKCVRNAKNWNTNMKNEKEKYKK